MQLIQGGRETETRKPISIFSHQKKGVTKILTGEAAGDGDLKNDKANHAAAGQGVIKDEFCFQEDMDSVWKSGGGNRTLHWMWANG